MEDFSKHYSTISEGFPPKRQCKKRFKKLKREKKLEEEDDLRSSSKGKDRLSKKRKMSTSKQVVSTDPDSSDCDDRTNTDSESDDSTACTEPSEASQRLKSFTKGGNVESFGKPEEVTREPDMEEAQPDDELKAVKAELSHMSFEELQQLKEKLGVKVFNQVMHGKTSRSVKRPPREKKVFTRENKSRPIERTSKKTVSRFRHVIPTKKKLIRDPRFDDRSGEYNEEFFKKSYSFIEDVKEREREKLQKQLKKAKDAEAKTKIKSLLNRMGQQQMAEETKAKKAEQEKEWNKREKELVAQGKKPFFLKKSDKRKLELAEKYRELKKSGKLEKYLSKKRKKNSQKERRKMLN